MNLTLSEFIFNDFKILNIDYLVIGNIVNDKLNITSEYKVFDIQTQYRDQSKKFMTSVWEIWTDHSWINICFGQGWEECFVRIVKSFIENQAIYLPSSPENIKLDNIKRWGGKDQWGCCPACYISRGVCSYNGYADKN